VIHMVPVALHAPILHRLRVTTEVVVAIRRSTRGDVRADDEAAARDPAATFRGRNAVDGLRIRYACAACRGMRPFGAHRNAVASALALLVDDAIELLLRGFARVRARSRGRGRRATSLLGWAVAVAARWSRRARGRRTSAGRTTAVGHVRDRLPVRRA